MPRKLYVKSQSAIVALAGVAVFVFFTAVSLISDRFSDLPVAVSPVTLLLRLGLSLVLAGLMLAIERRRTQASIEQAVRDGARVAVIIVLADNLGGPQGTASSIALRTLLLLAGLPLLTVLIHVLARHRGTGLANHLNDDVAT